MTVTHQTGGLTNITSDEKGCRINDFGRPLNPKRLSEGAAFLKTNINSKEIQSKKVSGKRESVDEQFDAKIRDAGK